MRCLILPMLLAACSTTSPLDAPDMTVDAAQPDLALPGHVGDPCGATSECHEGKSPKCWLHTIYNESNAPTTPGGYCTSMCSDDSDCGATGVCVSEGSNGKWCFSPCQEAGDCRTGFRCFTSTGNGHCYPSSQLQCDPTAPDGLCSDGRACLRYALGAGKTGYCFDTCTVGPGSCAPQNGTPRQCEVFDTTRDVDLDGNRQGDHFHGPICIYPSTPNPTGSECLSPSGYDSIYACVDGDQCWLGNQTDHKCHVLCTNAQMSMDGGTGDGGVAGACPTGTTCKDVFNLFASPTPIGLCL